MPMQPNLSNSFEAIESQRLTLQSATLALSGAQLKWVPSDEAWSTVQIIEHLVLSDETVGRAHESGPIKNEALMFRILPRAWRRVLVLRALRRDTVLPLPSPDVEPRGDVQLTELLSRWELARDETRRILGTIQKDRQLYSHPVMGPLNMAQMLELAQTHNAYHMRQIEALQSGVGFPK